MPIFRAFDKYTRSVLQLAVCEAAGVPTFHVSPRLYLWLQSLVALSQSSWLVGRGENRTCI